MTRLVCRGTGETTALACRLAPLLRPGDVILLDGEMGAGKTTFTQGLARALGVQGDVTSPTFTLVNVHPTAAGFDLVHADVYRLERLSEVVDLALPELIDDGAVVVVEWGGRAAAALPPDRLHVRITRPEEPDTETVRIVHLTADGPSWADRQSALMGVAA